MKFELMRFIIDDKLYNFWMIVCHIDEIVPFIDYKRCNFFLQLLYLEYVLLNISSHYIYFLIHLSKYNNMRQKNMVMVFLIQLTIFC